MNNDGPRSAPNTSETWDSCWDRDRSLMLEERTVSSMMDAIKFDYLAPLLPRTGSILEFGCGSARLLRFAASRGLTPMGLDFSPAALEVARQGEWRGASRGPLLVRGDVLASPLRAGSVDVVGSTGLLEHFTEPEKVVQEMVRVLRPGGLFYSDIVPKKFSLFRALDFLRRNQLKVFEREMSREDIAAMLTDAGLRDVRVFGAGVFPPALPVVERSATVRTVINRAVEATLPLWRALDGSPIADVAGFYFFATGYKPA